MNYRGRFAPTASGPLHAGSLLCALAGWLQARSASGQWMLRIDDLDEERCRPVHAATIQRQLDDHGLTWDGPVRFQSHHLGEYRDALERLDARGLLFPCTCTRATLARTSRPGPDGPVYSGRCRGSAAGGPAKPVSLRLKVGDGLLAIEDRFQGQLERDGTTDIGDFIVRRSDAQIAYQLASVIDESAQGITEIVRGSDLVGSSFRQLALRNRLDLPAVGHGHVPLLVSLSGDKLSKQNHAVPLDPLTAAANLFDALRRLGQAPPRELQRSNSVAEQLAWARDHWQPQQVPRTARLAEAT